MQDLRQSSTWIRVTIFGKRAARLDLIRNARKTAQHGDPDEVIALFESSERAILINTLEAVSSRKLLSPLPA